MRKPKIDCRLTRCADGTWIGIANVPIHPNASRIGALPIWSDNLTVQEIVNEAPIRREVTRRVMRREGPKIRRLHNNFLKAQEQYQTAAISGDGDSYEIGSFFGKLFDKAKGLVKSAVNNAKLVIKAAVNKEARKKLIEKLGNGIKKAGAVIKKVYEHPIFAGIVTAISVAVPGAQPLGITYAISRAAIKAAEKVAAGDPGAIADVADIAAQAASGHPGAQAVIQEIGRAGTVLASNPEMIPQELGKAALAYAKPKAEEFAKEQLSGVSQYAKDRAQMLTAGIPGVNANIQLPWQ